MRAREFISEERLDEIGPAALALWGVAIAGAGVQAYETYRDIEDYRTGKIDKAELGRRIGTDAAIAVAGGIAGKALQKGWQFSKAGIDMIRNSAKAKKAAETSGKITSAKPGSVIRTDKGNFIAGVDGKATTVAAGSRGARKAKRDIKRLAAKQEKSAAAGAATATVAKKAPTGKAGAGTATVAKKAPTGKAGAGTATVAKKSKLPVGKAAAGAAAMANSDQLSKADYFKDLGKKKPVVDFNPDDIIYTGKEKNPPVKRLPGGTSTNIGLKPSKPSTSAGATALNKAAEYTKGN